MTLGTQGITRRSFQTLLRPIEDFLMCDRHRGSWTNPICVKPSDTLEHVVLQFVATKVHKLYIVDSEKKPLGEITRTDVLQQLLV